MNRLSVFRACVLSSLGLGLGVFLVFLPRTGLTNSHQAGQIQAHSVTFVVVNHYDKRICLQGKASTTPICVGAHKRESISEPNTFMIETANLYTLPGRVRYWFEQNKDSAKEIFVARGSTEVHLRIQPNGDIHSRGLGANGSADLAAYITWHGLESLLQS